MEQDHLNLLTLKEKRTSQTLTQSIISSWPWVLHDHRERKVPNSNCYRLKVIGSERLAPSMRKLKFQAMCYKLEPILCTFSLSVRMLWFLNPLLLACALALTATLALTWLTTSVPTTSSFSRHCLPDSPSTNVFLHLLCPAHSVDLDLAPS